MAKHHLSIAFFSTKVNPPRRTLPSRTNHQARAIDKTGRLQGRQNKGEGGGDNRPSQDFSKSVNPISFRGEGGHHITTIPTLGCSDLPTVLVCALFGQAKLFDSIHNYFIGLIMKEEIKIVFKQP